MNILVLIHEFPPIGGGGGRIAQELAHELVQRGHQVTVIAPYLKGLPFISNTDGVQLIRLPSLRRQPYVADLLAMFGYLGIGLLVGLWQIRKFKPHLIHVHFAVPAGALAWMLSKLTGIPYVLTSHLGDVPGGVPEKTDAWFRWIYPFTPRIWRDAARVTAISEYTRKLALRHYPVDIRIIPNGIDLNAFPPVEMRPHTPPQIIFAGRLVPQKNPVRLIQILAGLNDLNWTCVILGDGPLMREVRQEISFHGLDERFSLTGWVRTEDVIRRLRESDILFLPSLSEGIPLVGLQSLAVGLAIVASQVGGISDLVVEGQNGYLPAPDDLIGFQTCLRKLIMDPALVLSMRHKSREIVRKFDLKAVVDAYQSVFQEILVINQVNGV